MDGMDETERKNAGLNSVSRINFHLDTSIPVTPVLALISLLNVIGEQTVMTAYMNFSGWSSL